MPFAQVFKRRYVFILLLIALAFSLYRFMNAPVEQRIVKTVPVNKLATLYITEADLGATTRASYRYYLYATKSGEAGFLESLKDDSEPFLLTDDANAQIKINDGAIHLTVRGNIYSFYNFPSCVSHGVVLSVPVYLDARPQ